MLISSMRAITLFPFMTDVSVGAGMATDAASHPARRADAITHPDSGGRIFISDNGFLRSILAMAYGTHIVVAMAIIATVPSMTAALVSNIPTINGAKIRRRGTRASISS